MNQKTKNQTDAKKTILSNGMTLQNVHNRCEEDERISKEFKSKGANRDGNRSIDKKYKKHLEDSIKFLLQFSEDEMKIIVGLSITENPKAWGMLKKT